MMISNVTQRVFTLLLHIFMGSDPYKYVEVATNTFLDVKLIKCNGTY